MCFVTAAYQMHPASGLFSNIQSKLRVSVYQDINCCILSRR